jgi:hypothetical protein
MFVLLVSRFKRKGRDAASSLVVTYPAIAMKRPAIPDPIIVSLTGGKETPTGARDASPTDLRQTKVDEFIAA